MSKILTFFLFSISFSCLSQNHTVYDSIEKDDYLRGNVYFMIEKNYTKAIECYDRYIKSNGGWINSALIYRGQCKSALKNDIGAIADYNASIKMDSINADAYFSRADSKSELGDYHGAIKDYTSSIRLKKKSLEIVFFNRSLAYYELNEFEKCIADLNSAISIVPNNGYYYYIKGNVFYVMGKDEEACKLFSKSGELGYLKAYEDISVKCK